MEDKHSNVGIAERQDNENSIFNLKWIITTLLAIWPWFLGSMMVAYLLCNLYLRYTTPIYRISGEIILNDSKNGSSESEMLEGLGLKTGKADIVNIIRILRSKTLMLKVVNELDLHIQYFEPGKVKMFEYYENAPFKMSFADSSAESFSPSYQVTFKNNQYALKVGKNIWRGRVGDSLLLPAGKVVIQYNSGGIKDNVPYIVNVSNRYATAGRFAGSISVTRNDKSSTSLELATQDELPNRGIDILNTLIKVYEQNNIEDRNRISNNTIKFIDDRLSKVQDDLSLVEGKIQNFKETNNVLDIKAQGSSFLSTSDKYLGESRDKEVELKILGELQDFLLKSGKSDTTLPSFMMSDANLSQLINEYNSLQTQKINLGVYNTKKNPVIVSIDQQLISYKLKIINSINALKNTLTISINEYNRQHDIANSELRTIPAKERQFLEFSRQQTIRQDLYLFLLKKREEAAISVSSTVSNLSVVDKADVNGLVKPNRSKLTMFSLFLGFLAPILGLGIRRTFNTKIIAKNDIIKHTDIPIIGEIGHSNDEIAVAVKKNSNSILAEQFRALRTNLQFLLTDKLDKVILLTSSMSGEGKSFIAINLASTFAISGKKVVLVELDLRRPKISKNLGLDNGIGLSNYAIGQADIDQIILRSGFEENLFVIPSGPIPPNPAELIMLPQIEELFEILKSKFDYIVIDTAPIGLVTDAQLLSRYADTSLYVVRQGYTYKQQMHIANELKNNDKLAKLGLVINDVVFKRGYSYGYGYGYEAGYGSKYGYGYGYGYGYSYGNNNNNNNANSDYQNSKLRVNLVKRLKRKKDKM